MPGRPSGSAACELIQLAEMAAASASRVLTAGSWCATGTSSATSPRASARRRVECLAQGRGVHGDALDRGSGHETILLAEAHRPVGRWVVVGGDHLRDDLVHGGRDPRRHRRRRRPLGGPACGAGSRHPRADCRSAPRRRPRRRWPRGRRSDRGRRTGTCASPRRPAASACPHRVTGGLPPGLGIAAARSMPPIGMPATLTPGMTRSAWLIAMAADAPAITSSPAAAWRRKPNRKPRRVGPGRSSTRGRARAVSVVIGRSWSSRAQDDRPTLRRNCGAVRRQACSLQDAATPGGVARSAIQSGRAGGILAVVGRAVERRWSWPLRRPSGGPPRLAGGCSGAILRRRVAACLPALISCFPTRGSFVARKARTWKGARTPQALKRVRQEHRRRAVNRRARSEAKTLVQQRQRHRARSR